jgi:hypothetical protein
MFPQYQMMVPEYLHRLNKCSLIIIKVFHIFQLINGVPSFLEYYSNSMCFFSNHYLVRGQYSGYYLKNLSYQYLNFHKKRSFYYEYSLTLNRILFTLPTIFISLFPNNLIKTILSFI